MLFNNQNNGQKEVIGIELLKMILDRDLLIILKVEDLHRGMKEIWKIGNRSENRAELKN